MKPSSPVALIAVGGYGRQEQCPASDVDLMVFHGGELTDEVGRAAKALFYELWDAGLVVGNSTRTPKEALRAAREDFAAETSYLSARLITGDRTLFDRFVAETLQASRRSPEAFLERARVATLERRERTGDATAELEPNLKEGKGALRDLETIHWLDKVCGENQLTVDRAELEQAFDYLLRVRCALHLVAGSHTDVLLMYLQTQVCELLQLDSLPDETLGPAQGFDPEDVLMRRLYSKSRQIAFALDSVLSPEFQLAAAGMPADLLEGKWSPPAVRAFIDILAAGTGGWPAFRLLEQTGALVRAIPEWQAIACLPQRNVYHRHAVDVHCFETAAFMAGFFAAAEKASPADTRTASGKSPARKWLFRSQGEGRQEVPAETGSPFDWQRLTTKVAADSLKVRDRLLLAALLHDVGKGTLEDHAVRGVRMSRAALGRMGIPLLEKEDVAWLVRSHLLLTKTAVRRNIEDESLVVELAETIGSTERLRMLYLLSAADGLATGPSAWSGWTATLVGDLFTRIYNVLDKGELVNADASRTAHARESELRTALNGYEKGQVDAHLGAMPRMWLLTQTLPALIRQSKLMIPAPDAQGLHMDRVALEQQDHWEVTLVGRDRPGFFSKVSGVLALHGLNVLAAQIFTRQDGVALEVFTVTGADGRFERVEQDINKALRGKISLDLRLSQKRSDYSGRVSRGKQDPPQVRIDNGSSDFYTVIEVHAPDRVGLLYDITRALTELELDILLAKVATYAEDVVDVFYVWDLEGQKVTEGEHLREIQRLILHRLAQN